MVVVVVVVVGCWRGVVGGRGGGERRGSKIPRAASADLAHGRSLGLGGGGGRVPAREPTVRFAAPASGCTLQRPAPSTVLSPLAADPGCRRAGNAGVHRVELSWAVAIVDCSPPGTRNSTQSKSPRPKGSTRRKRHPLPLVKKEDSLFASPEGINKHWSRSIEACGHHAAWHTGSVWVRLNIYSVQLSCAGVPVLYMQSMVLSWPNQIP